MSDLPLMVAETPVGSTATVTVIREGKEMALPVKIEELAEEKAAPPAKQGG